jgi:hypothetical protein
MRQSPDSNNRFNALLQCPASIITPLFIRSPVHAVTALQNIADINITIIAQYTIRAMLHFWMMLDENRFELIVPSLVPQMASSSPRPICEQFRAMFA